MLTELITLLTCDGLEGDDLADCVARIEASPADPELEWIEGDGPAAFMQFAILAELGDFVAIGDKVDELHEEISEQFADPLPAFPGQEMPAAEYFQWLDGQLAARPTPYEILLWGNHFDDNLYAFIVRRKDTARVLDLADGLGLLAERATRRQLT
ncbi:MULTISPECIES: hypothetical protein [Stenotrophomonas]|uniref:Uncharacterized protein n=1 Tax=Stenotrophomonas nitritireducens TaxID=83617 RepID=A0ABR5NJ43_9GAMM|nr:MULTISPECIES: hypothetical protein [Stenotrophomonas]KQO00251.1 hypothetical protein ASF01_04675 [Stenotrophomonas sp. Leaf70]KRG56850.1 hypothetical protein ABB22_10375 [Stenotrophomonas nitritireducens]MBN8791561.1 hypothetical protein [Stenotrophomonas nitritireducens]MBN8795499.1 hypothetical protein [Stenotrophomonas nitritireducens]